MSEEIIILARFKNQPFCHCRKAHDDHTPEEAITCARVEQERVALMLCSTCGLAFGVHSDEDVKACSNKQRDMKLKDVRCPICNRLVLEHSNSESVACFEKGRASKHG